MVPAKLKDFHAYLFKKSTAFLVKKRQKDSKNVQYLKVKTVGVVKKKVSKHTYPLLKSNFLRGCCMSRKDLIERLPWFYD